MRVISTMIFCLLIALAACSSIPPGVDKTCITRVQKYHVLGHSLDGVVEHESNVTVLEGYQRCNNLTYGDIALFRTAIRPNAVIKIVMGLPGDRMRLENYTLYRNGEPLRMLNGTQYRISARSTATLAPYLNATSIIPPGAYFLLGNDPLGGLDSSQLGYINVDDIIGVVQKH